MLSALESIETSEINKSINITYENQIMINIEVIVSHVYNYNTIQQYGLTL